MNSVRDHDVPDGTDPVVLIEPTTPQQYRDWHLALIGGIDDLPSVMRSRIQAPEVELKDLLDAMLPGDELWRCRSRHYEPNALMGFQGIAIVRNGKPVKYRVAFHH